MPVYEYKHLEKPGPDCSPVVELSHSIHETIEHCPDCGGPVTKIVSRFAYRKDVLATTNIKDKGFRRFRRKDKGVYEED